MVSGVPAIVKLTPQVLLLQVRSAHSVSLPAHWVGALHCTHAPVALQNWLPLHAVLIGSGVCAGVVPLHAAAVHGLPSSAGRSLASATSSVPPSPAHCACWQSPAVWLASAVPASAKAMPHTL